MGLERQERMEFFTPTGPGKLQPPQLVKTLKRRVRVVCPGPVIDGQP
jgi:hypothetical protein